MDESSWQKSCRVKASKRVSQEEKGRVFRQKSEKMPRSRRKTAAVILRENLKENFFKGGPLCIKYSLQCMKKTAGYVYFSWKRPYLCVKISYIGKT